MKKILIGILSTVAIIAILIGGKIQMDKYRVKTIIHGEEGKAAIENMLKIMDEKALTPEGKIKSYQIDENYTHNNPMGGLIVRVIINDDPELDVETTLNKYPSRGKLEHGVIITSEKLSKLVPDKGLLSEEKGNEQDR
ncbi:DUF1310 family protein [Gemella haemolysans]|uniref:DUF1310 family protein n=2 Tax=Gemella haemolysans TaxID=1379 RepID=C5NV25_9BACL|nr:DUF1310 family protein [Gemella haemolysans]EER68829.1 hypothetical protein GEMHA0001_1402 [Gemella haemolysans ATCC 10379]KAA8707963.1 DUF1310 family protein [Gemella haemolysans]UBH81938.1 DUF1310 domain-containing protein [Gemella haemolysans]VEI38147.1 Protein of uncharacterised function (DUF1310) [Gemella haemolysans]